MSMRRVTSPKLIKVDTDGMDCEILMSSAVLLGQARPVLFFEYDPYLTQLAGPKAQEVFPFLLSLGYRRMLVYENTGDFLITADLDDHRLMGELHDFYLGRKSIRYADVCVFHANDLDLCDDIRRSELKYFNGVRT